jgi:hypothetical protein
MATTMPLTVAAIRRILKDKPVEDYLTAAITLTTATTTTVNTPSLWGKGNTLEFDDGASGAEQVLLRDVDTSTSTLTMKRGHNGSVAATHANNCVVLKNPRFPYDEVAQAVNMVLDADLYSNDVYEIVEHQVTSSATTNAYNKPTSACERPLNIYQVIDSGDEAFYLKNWSPRYFNADTSLYSNGGYIAIRENLGTAGSAVFYVNCAHKLAITTVSTSQERILHNLAAYYLLTWEAPKRTAGPTTQGDRSVQPMTPAQLGLFFKSEGDRLVREEADYIKQQLVPGGRRFVRRARYN